MKKTVVSFVCLLALTALTGAQPCAPGVSPVRPAPTWLTRGVIYQVWLRAFTPEGTLKAAKARLPQVAALGVTIVYLPPVYLQDDDMRQEYWSKRQRSCGANNPRNPYRIKDYDAIDPEYGTEEDLRAFIAEAHRLDMRVLMDIVYFHCGPTTVLLDRPGFITRNAAGAMAIGPWGFPTPNFNNPAVGEYFIANMLHWVKECGADGFRGDVSDLVPLDFWEAARKRLEAVRPDIVMLGEGDHTRAANQIAAFDIDYALGWHDALCEVMAGNKPAAEMQTVWKGYLKGRPQGVRFIRYTDHHDSANGPVRVETLWGNRGADAALVATFTLDGVPFLYNGQEIADADVHSIYSRMLIDWSKDDTPAAQMRLALCKRLCALRRDERVLTQGGVIWLENDQPDAVMSYSRSLGDDQIISVINLKNHPVNVVVMGCDATVKPLLAEGAEWHQQATLVLKAYGYFIGKR